MLRFFTLITISLFLSGCNESYSDKYHSNSNGGSNSNSGSNSNGGSSLSAIEGNVFTVINGFLNEANSSGRSLFDHYTKISVSNSIPLFQGSDIVSTPIQLSIASFPNKGGSKKATIIIETGGWHCYKATNLVAERNNNRIIVDGKMEEYAYDYNVQECGTNLIASYEFNNATMGDDLVLEQPNTAFFIDSLGAKTPLRKYEYLVSSYSDQLKDAFGPAWRTIQLPYIDDAANKVGSSMFAMDASGAIELRVSSNDLYDFNSLSQSGILNGTLWGSPSGGAASKNWCKIVNIPKGVSSSALQYQTVIATNCARSTQRYCDAHGSDPAGDYPAVSPVAWDDGLKIDAQITSDEQYIRNAQGHWGARNAQNAFIPEFKSAIIPIIGYSEPRTDGKVNNAGHNSWAGHEGHCQNVMGVGHTMVGIASRDAKPLAKPGIQAFWAQDFK